MSPNPSSPATSTADPVEELVDEVALRRANGVSRLIKEHGFTTVAAALVLVFGLWRLPQILEAQTVRIETSNAAVVAKLEQHAKEALAVSTEAAERGRRMEALMYGVCMGVNRGNPDGMSWCQALR